MKRKSYVTVITIIFIVIAVAYIKGSSIHDFFYKPKTLTELTEPLLTCLRSIDDKKYTKIFVRRRNLLKLYEIREKNWKLVKKICKKDIEFATKNYSNINDKPINNIKFTKELISSVKYYVNLKTEKPVVFKSLPTYIRDGKTAYFLQGYYYVTMTRFYNPFTKLNPRSTQK